MASSNDEGASRRLEREGRQVRQRAAVRAMHNDVVRFCQELSMAIDMFMRSSVAQVEHDMSQLLANLGALADIVSERRTGRGSDAAGQASVAASTSDGAGSSRTDAASEGGPLTPTGRDIPEAAIRAAAAINRGSFWRRVGPGQPHNIAYGPLRFALTLRRRNVPKNDWFLALSARTLAKRQRDGLCAEESTCCICLEPLDGPIRQPITCKHVFHGDCIDKWFKSSPLLRPRCPICRVYFKSRAEHARDQREKGGRRGDGDGPSGTGSALLTPAAR